MVVQNSHCVVYSLLDKIAAENKDGIESEISSQQGNGDLSAEKRGETPTTLFSDVSLDYAIRKYYAAFLALGMLSAQSRLDRDDIHHILEVKKAAPRSVRIRDFPKVCLTYSLFVVVCCSLFVP